MNVILRTWFQTGLGDFYACLLSTKIGYDFLKTKGYNVKVIISYESSHYGMDLQTNLLNECFGLTVFDNIGLNEKIPDNFKFCHNIDYAYEIYTVNDDICSEIDRSNLHGYSVESIFGGTPYPSEYYRDNLVLFKSNFIDEVKNIVSNYGRFLTIFYRFPDSHTLNENDILDFTNKIKSISKENEGLNIFMSCKIQQVLDIFTGDDRFLKLEYNVSSNYERVKRDLINMCILMYSEKIYYRIYHWSNYLTLSFVHNKSEKKYNNFLIRIF